MPRLHNHVTFLFLTLGALWLGGCDSSTQASWPEGTGAELPAGSYFIQSDNDDYRYDQYFVIQAGHRWEFVEYGYVPSTKNLCQVTRQKGVYSATDTTLTITATAGGESLQKCGITKAEFDAYPFEAAPSGATEVFQIRFVTANGFDGMYFFLEAPSGWQTYTKKTDPYGFF